MGGQPHEPFPPAAAHLGGAARALIGPGSTGQSGGRWYNVLQPPVRQDQHVPGWFQAGWGGQRNRATGPVVTAESCINLIANAASQLTLHHLAPAAAGGRITDSNAARILRRPGKLSAPELTSLLVREILVTGDAFCWARRSPTGEILELVPIPSSTVRVSKLHRRRSHRPANFYDMAIQNSETKEPYYVPARDVLHIRAHVNPHDPLRGISAIGQAATALELAGLISRDQINFYSNGARPSGVLQTDSSVALKREQVSQL